MPDHGGIAAGAALGGVITARTSGPGYVFTEEQLRALATKWEDLADRYKDNQRKARIIAEAEGPGAEYASGDNARLVRASGQTLWTTLKAREQFCREQAAKFRAASGAYTSAEDDAAADVIKQEGKFG